MRGVDDHAGKDTHTNRESDAERGIPHLTDLPPPDTRMDLPGTAPTRLFGLAPPGLDNSCVDVLSRLREPTVRPSELTDVGTPFPARARRVILSTSAGDTPLPRA